MIIERIKAETGIDVTIKSRKREQVEMKALASYALRKKGLSLSQIGNKLNLNHATIIHHLKRYESYKFYNPKIEELELKLLGKKPDDLLTKLYNTIEQQEKEIKKLNFQLKQLQSNQKIKRLLALLKNEVVQQKFDAFLNINEKARYYKKYE